MFVSFFPKPRLFFISVVAWTLVMVLFWFFGGERLGARFGLPPLPAGTEQVNSVTVFWSPAFLWFYIYFWAGVAIFAAFWMTYAPHRWQLWSVVGSALILFSIYFQVQVSVAINVWRGPFFDLVQKALTPPSGSVTQGELLHLIAVFSEIAFLAIFVGTLQSFFISHFIFRWRTAMNEFYIANWERLRHLEGASQRVQDDTMRFAQITEDLGTSLVGSIMTLIAFLPLLATYSSYVTDIWFIGVIPYSLVWVAIGWSLFGTVLLAVVGIKLPGLEFRNQRVEAAYRKELVYGEDDTSRAAPPTLSQLFANVRKNYFRLYFNYAYFNVARNFYQQADNIFIYVVLIPTIAAGKITFGILQQILTAFGQVSNSFQYLVNSWPDVITWLSIYKRLRAFEATLYGKPLPDIDRHYLQREQAGLRPEEQPAA